MKFRSSAFFSFGFLALFCLLVPGSARADTFDWQYQGTISNVATGSLSSGSGELIDVNGVVTDLSGTFNGVTIIGRLVPNSFGGNDNLLLFPGPQPYLTTGGISFADSNNILINIYGIVNPDTLYGSVTSDGLSDLGNFTLEPIATPEPGTSALLFTGMLGLALLVGSGQMRRKATD